MGVIEAVELADAIGRGIVELAEILLFAVGVVAFADEIVPLLERGKSFHLSRIPPLSPAVSPPGRVPDARDVLLVKAISDREYDLRNLNR